MKSLLLTLLIAVLAPPAMTLDQALAKLDAFNKTFHSMQASLEKTNVVVLVDDHELSKGEIFYKKGTTSSQIRLDFQTPAPQIVLIAAGKVTVYSPKLKQANQASIGGGKDQAESHLLVGFGSSSEDLKKTYDVTLGGEAVIDGKSTAILDLKPKTSSMFTSIRLWINEQVGNPVQIQLNEPNRDYAVFKFINPNFKVNLPDSKFDVKSVVPSGVKIQTMG